MGSRRDVSSLVLVTLLLVLVGCRVSEVTPQGSWHLVREGTFEAVPWKLFSTEPTASGTCLNLETPFDVELTDDLAEGLYEGRAPACLFFPQQKSTNRFVSAVQSMEYGDLDGQRDLGFVIGLVAPDVEKVTITMGDEELELDISDGFLSVLYDAELPPSKMTIQTAGGVTTCNVQANGPVGDFSC